MVGKVTIIIIGVLLIGFLAAGGATVSKDALRKLRFEADKLRGKDTERK